MMEAIEQWEHKGCVISMYYDDDPFSPREADNLGIMVCGHRRYDLGDVNAATEYPDAETIAELVAAVKEEDGAVNVILLFLIDHSGISMRAGRGFEDCDPGGWDSGPVGVIYTNKERIDATGAPMDSIDRQLRAEVEEYDDYLTGNVVGYVVELAGEVVDSCWGFIGSESYNYAKKEAEASAEFYANKREEDQHAAFMATVVEAATR